MKWKWKCVLVNITSKAGFSHAVSHFYCFYCRYISSLAITCYRCHSVFINENGVIVARGTNAFLIHQSTSPCMHTHTNTHTIRTYVSWICGKQAYIVDAATATATATTTTFVVIIVIVDTRTNSNSHWIFQLIFIMIFNLITAYYKI